MKLNEQYKITSDSYNLTLLKKSKGNKGTYSIEGYYGKIEHLYNDILQNEIKDNIGDFTKFYERTKELEQFIIDNTVTEIT